MSIWTILFAALVVTVGWKKAITATIQGYAMGLAIAAGIIIICLLLLSMCTVGVRG
jgi:hypothetical protein